MKVNNMSVSVEFLDFFTKVSKGLTDAELRGSNTQGAIYVQGFITDRGLIDDALRVLPSSYTKRKVEARGDFWFGVFDPVVEKAKDVEKETQHESSAVTYRIRYKSDTGSWYVRHKWHAVNRTFETVELAEFWAKGLNLFQYEIIETLHINNSATLKDDLREIILTQLSPEAREVLRDA